MLIKGNKSKKKKEEEARAQAPATLPDQIMDFIGNEVERTSAERGVIDEAALEGILGKNLNQLNLEAMRPSPEEVEAEAKRLIAERSEQLIKELEEELAEKKRSQDAELAEKKQSAEKQAQEIIDEAKELVLTEAKALDEKKQGFKKEQEEHFKQLDMLRYEALKDAIEEAEPYVVELVEIFRNLHSDKREVAKVVKENVATIAYDVARQVLNYEVDHNENLLEQQVLHSVNKLLDTKGVMKLVLNPNDKVKKKLVEELLKNILDASVRLVFSYDEKIDQGSCTIETQGGKLDSSFSTQLDTIKAAFEQYLGHKISILPDIPMPEEVLEESNDASEELEMSKSEKELLNANLAKAGTLEPSDAELTDLEDNFEDFANLDIEEDLDTLFNELDMDADSSQDDKAKDEKEAKAPEIKIEEIEDLSLVEVNDGKEIGANDYANGEDWVAEEEDLEDLSEKPKSKEYEDEDGNKFVEYNEFADDENFGDSGEMTDERFPEY